MARLLMLTYLTQHVTSSFFLQTDTHLKSTRDEYAAAGSRVTTSQLKVRMFHNRQVLWWRIVSPSTDRCSQLSVCPAQNGFKASLFVCSAPDNATLFVLCAELDLEARLCCNYRIRKYPVIDMYLCSAMQTALTAAMHTFSESPSPIEPF